MHRELYATALSALLCSACAHRSGSPADDAAVSAADADARSRRSDAVAAEGGCGPAAAEVLRDLPYAAVAGVDPALLSLDLYLPARPDRCRPAPVVVWVHGGGWATGDKGNRMPDKVALFNGAGYVLASVNYRLSPTEPTMASDRIKHPIHVQDVAAALDWVLRHVQDHGGAPQRLALIGHSAGAHLVTLLSSDEQYLGQHGHALAAIRCTASLDTEAYDVPRALADAAAQQRTIFENAFGTDEAVQAAASPQNHVAAGKGMPSFLLALRGTPARKALATSFAEALEAAGVTVQVVDASGLSHEEVNEAVGKAGDAVITPPLVDFFADCLAAD